MNPVPIGNEDADTDDDVVEMADDDEEVEPDEFVRCFLPYARRAASRRSNALYG
jgi:hypothetical protein